MTTKAPQDYDILRQQMSERYESLSKRLRQIAKFAWDNPTIMAMETTAVIAERAEVQPSALIRFAKAFGYSGFSDMQRIFQAHVTARSASYKERFRKAAEREEISGDSPGGMLKEYCDASRNALEHLQDETDPVALEQAVALLASAEYIYVMGQRRSFPVATYVYYNLTHLDCRAQLLTGMGGMLLEHADSMTANDVLVAISYSPYSEDTAKVVAAAREKGVPVIVLTDSSLNAIARQATVFFDIHDAEVFSFRSLTASMCLAQALTTALATDRADLSSGLPARGKRQR
ncbi:SIS domain-containing protein [Seongchinamella sediminis]|uniref:SIS domain-containing protein n=1 Tax=Seongchinamella sediminis TaxID=2283635 RepID=A0A3L7E0U5_9GAMM|nr:MurR/RpiR family transcriptional regulator [Seongchinamella sediminis]RLQ21742.1 SIS domain-containing protein [Seongchinamella sediminis]